MTHHAADDAAGMATGAALGVAFRLAEWVQVSSMAGEVLHTLAFGMIGGAAGFLGKRLIEHLLTKKNRNNQSDQ